MHTLNGRWKWKKEEQEKRERNGTEHKLKRNEQRLSEWNAGTSVYLVYFIFKYALCSFYSSKIDAIRSVECVMLCMQRVDWKPDERRLQIQNVIYSRRMLNNLFLFIPSFVYFDYAALSFLHPLNPKSCMWTVCWFCFCWYCVCPLVFHSHLSLHFHIDSKSMQNT